MAYFYRTSVSIFFMINYLLLPDEEEDDRLPPELLDLTLDPELLPDDPLLR